MKTLLRDRGFYRRFITMTLLISLQMLITFSVNLADNLMLGAYSEQALSGASVVNQIQYLLQSVISGFSGGVVAIGSQYWGQCQTVPIKKVLSIGIKFAVLTGLVFTLATLLWPREVLLLFTNDEAVIQQGIEYLRLIAYTYLVFSISNMLLMSLRSVETTAIGSVMSLVTLGVNVCLNYVFIFGRFGAPELGIYGAALATLVSRVVELLIIVIYVFFLDKKLHLRLRDLLVTDMREVKNYVRVTLPLLGSAASWGIAVSVQTAILGHMTATAIAANSIAGTVSQISGVLGLATASSAAVVIGKTVGEGRTEMVRPYSYALQGMFVLIGLFSGGLLFAIKDVVLRLYALSPETHELALTYILILCVTNIGTCYEYPVGCGIIQGGGNTKYPLLIDTFFMWGFTLPLSAAAAFWWDLSPVWVFLFLKSDQVIKCIPNAIYCNRFTWVRELTK